MYLSVIIGYVCLKNTITTRSKFDVDCGMVSITILNIMPQPTNWGPKTNFFDDFATQRQL